MPTFPRSQGIFAGFGFINTVNDAVPGGGTGAPPGITLGRAPGQAGARVTLGKDEVVFDPTVGLVEEGTFQYVQTFSTDTVAPVRGKLAFWKDKSNYVVSTDDTNVNEVMGAFLNDAAHITKGNWTVVQAFGEGGRAYVDFGANTVAAQEVVFPAGGGTAVANRNVAGTSLTAATFGIAQGAKSAGNIALVELFGGQS